MHTLCGSETPTTTIVTTESPDLTYPSTDESSSHFTSSHELIQNANKADSYMEDTWIPKDKERESPWAAWKNPEFQDLNVLDRLRSLINIWFSSIVAEENYNNVPVTLRIRKVK